VLIRGRLPFEHQLAQPAHEELAFEERFALLLDQEILYRDNRRLSRLLKAAKLRVNACVEDIDYRHPRGASSGSQTKAPALPGDTYSA
jgi:hypothetical protein